ncbi:MAG: heme NO-binding domain-containing protein, partial [Myxococcota bacterium]
MKGIVFTEFLEMVEDRFGFEAVDRLVTASGSDNDGVYTAVGTYDH